MANTFTDLHVTASTDSNADTVPTTGLVTISPNDTPSGVSAGSVNSFLATGDVTLTTVGSPDNSEAGDVVVDSGGAINWLTAQKLEFDAAGSISLNDAITGTNAGSVLAVNANGGSISQLSAGVITVGGLAATASGSIALDTATNATRLVAFNASGSVTYASSSDIIIDQVGSVTGATGSTVALTTTGAAATITQTKAINTTTLTLATGANGQITLTNAGNKIDTIQGSGTWGSTAHTISDSDGGLNIGPITSGANVSLATSGGDLIVVGDVNVGANTLALTDFGDYNITATAAAITAGTLTVETGAGGGADIETAAHSVGTIATTGAGVGSGGLTFKQSTGGTIVGAITSAGNVFIQDSAGAVTVSGIVDTSGANANVTLNASASTLAINNQIKAGTGTVSLEAPGGITQAASGAGISAGSLRAVSTSGNIGLAPANATAADENNVGVFAASATSGSVSFANAGIFEIGTVGATSGITADTTVSLQTSTTGAAITQSQAISAATLIVTTSDGSVTLDNAGNNVGTLGTVNLGSGNFSLTDSVALTLSDTVTAGGVSITDDDIAINSTINVGTGSVTLAPLTAGRQIDLGSETSGTLSLTNTELDAITAGALTIGSSSAGKITVSAAITPANVGTLALVSGDSISLAADVGVTALSLNAPGGISQTGGKITATSVDANALAGTTSLTSADNAFSTITGNGTGGFTVIDAQSLSTGFGGVLSALGDVSLTTVGTGSDLTVALDGAIAAATGTVTLTAAHNVILNDTVSAASLVLNTSGETDINVVLGDFDPLGSLTTDTGGTTHINGGWIETTGTQTYNDAVVLGALTVLTGSSVTFASTVNSGGFPLTVTANSIDFNGGTNSVTGTSTLLLQQLAANVSVGIGTGAAGTFNLSDSDLAALADGFAAITLGRADGNSITTVNEVTFRDPVTIRDGSIVVNGAIAGTGDASITLIGAATLNNNITSTEGIAINGTVTLGANAILTSTGAGTIVFADVVNGAFDLTADTAGTTIFGGAVGGTTALASLTTDAGGSTAINGGSVTTTGAQAYHDAVTLGGTTHLTGTAITFDSTVNIGSFGLTVTDSGAGLFSGAISGGGGFTQAGSGATTLAATNLYTGATTINAGTLLVDGSIASATTTVNSGGTLGGHGTTGAVFVNGGGHLAAGNSAGILTTGNLSLVGGANFDEQIGGTTPGAMGYDQLQVHGTVSLGGAALNVTQIDSFFVNGAAADNFTIIDNDGTDAVTGQFAGLAEGATLTIGGGTFLITYHGGDGNDVVLLAANNVPSLSGLGDTPSYTENGAAVLLNTEGTATVSDAELNTFESYAGATLTLARHGGANPDDVFSSVGSGTGALVLTDANVSLGSDVVGAFNQQDGALTITFNGSASADDVNQVMRQLGYANTSDNPPASVAIDFTFSDGNGQPGGQDQGPGAKPGAVTGSVTVHVNQVDDAPLLINVAPSAAYGIGSSGAVLSPALGVFDIDATPPSTLTGLASATIKIVNGFLAGDQLFVNLATDISTGHLKTPDGVVTGISASYALGTLTLSGSSSVQDYQSVLDAVSYTSSAADPTNGGADTHRTITWTVNDGSLNSPAPNTNPDNLVNATILHFDAVPVLDLDASAPGSGFTTSYTENGTGVGIVDSDVTISDSDTAAMASATVVLTNAKAGDTLSIAGALPGGIESSVDTSAAGQITLHLINSAPVADYQTALRQITFSSSSDNPGSADRDIAIVVSDGEVESAAAHATVHVIPVNDAPLVTGSVTLAPIDQNRSARLITQADLLSNVSDPDGPSLTATNLAISDGLGTLIDNHNGTWGYTPGPNDPTSVSFSYQVTDGIAAPVSDSATLDIIGNQPRPVPLVTLHGSAGGDSFDALPGNSRIDGQGGIDTISFNFKLVDATVSFIGNQVIVDGPTGSHTVLTGFEVFNFTDGTVNENDGNPLVDDLYYYSQYHDVWNAHVDADAHYNTFGWHEGRNPDAFFSTVLYLSANPDVKAAGVNPLTQYDTVGWTQGRDPSILFDTDAYLKAYPDVAAAHVDPLAHFLAFGAQEGRTPFAPTSIIAGNGFDYVYYLQHNPDVAAANVDPLQHYEVFGWKEGRNPNAYFDNNGYLTNYPDVAAAGVNPLDHYHTFGWQEGRDPSVNFDTTSYLAAYPDVTAAHVDPLKHFLQYGLTEGRQSFADGVWG
jgi:hypothetical protein